MTTTRSKIEAISQTTISELRELQTQIKTGDPEVLAERLSEIQSKGMWTAIFALADAIDSAPRDVARRLSI